MAPSALGQVMARATDGVAHSDLLDEPARVLRWIGEQLVADDGRARLLHGAPIGHALHPVLTDLPIGFWTASTVLDLTGPRGSDRAADRLLGLGLLAALPTIVSGTADWVATEGGDAALRRIGTAHWLLNGGAVTMNTLSWVARRRGRRRLGVALSMIAGGVTFAGGFLGGHMALVLKMPPAELSAPR